MKCTELSDTPQNCRRFDKKYTQGEKARLQYSGVQAEYSELQRSTSRVQPKPRISASGNERKGQEKWSFPTGKLRKSMGIGSSIPGQKIFGFFGDFRPFPTRKNNNPGQSRPVESCRLGIMSAGSFPENAGILTNGFRRYPDRNPTKSATNSTESCRIWLGFAGFHRVLSDSGPDFVGIR
jgi:hypothetical protein